MIYDQRRLHTIQLDLLRSLVQAGQRRARLQPLYREHLGKHFADGFSRIGLPRPYHYNTVPVLKPPFGPTSYDPPYLVPR